MHVTEYAWSGGEYVDARHLGSTRLIQTKPLHGFKPCWEHASIPSELA
jgi:hypothetical protein